MTKIEGYKCDVCGKFFEAQYDAEVCEKSHTEAMSVYEMGFNKGEVIPKTIFVEMKNGYGNTTLAKYEFLTQL